MKLREKRDGKKPRLKTVELLTPAQETVRRFDPRVDLPEEEWMLSSTLELPTTELLCLWEAQLYLNPERFDQLRKTAEQLQPTQLSQTRFIREAKQEVNFYKRLELSLAVRVLFPEAQTDQHFSEDIQGLIPQLNQIRQGTDNPSTNAIKILYLIKRSPTLASPENPTLQPDEWEKVKDWWNEVWVVGYLEDVAPDTLVELMAKMRVVDPERFKEITLDQKFWDLALGWLRTLRAEASTKDSFIFSFYLHLLAAESVEVDSDGKLRIQSRSPGVLKKPTPLPERNSVA